MNKYIAAAIAGFFALLAGIEVVTLFVNPVLGIGLGILLGFSYGWFVMGPVIGGVKPFTAPGDFRASRKLGA